MAFIDERQTRKERRFITRHRNEPVHRIGSGPDVARRAYELFQARGGEPGHELENWLEAERELGQSSRDLNEQSRGPRRDRDR